MVPDGLQQRQHEDQAQAVGRRGEGPQVRAHLRRLRRDWEHREIKYTINLHFFIVNYESEPDQKPKSSYSFICSVIEGTEHHFIIHASTFHECLSDCKSGTRLWEGFKLKVFVNISKSWLDESVEREESSEARVLSSSGLFLLASSQNLTLCSFLSFSSASGSDSLDRMP